MKLFIAITVFICSFVASIFKSMYMQTALIFFIIVAASSYHDTGVADWHRAFIFSIIPIWIFLTGVCLGEGLIRAVTSGNRVNIQSIKKSDLSE